MNVDVELVKFGEVEIPLPVTVGQINEFRAVAERLKREIANAAEYDAQPKRIQLKQIETAIEQLQNRLEALEREGDNAVAANMPEGVFRGGTGFYYRTVDGVTSLVCEDCWELMPNYLEKDFRGGLISPESDGDPGGNFVKRRRQVIEGHIGEWHPGKAVCIPCYRAAFQRFYNREAPYFDETLQNAPRVAQKTTQEPFYFIPAPKGPLEAEPVLVTP